MHATFNLTYGLSQTWAKIWGFGWICFLKFCLQYGRFYFGVLALNDFAYNNFVFNILACQMEGPTYFLDLLLL